MEASLHEPGLARVLWVGQDEGLRGGVWAVLRAHGWSMVACRAGREVLDCILLAEADLIVLDADASALNIWDLLAELREWQVKPVIVLARDSQLCIDAFRRGADDFVGKPINPLELLVRAQALLQRAIPGGSVTTTEQQVSIGPLRLDRAVGSVFCNDQSLGFTPVQFRLLWHLVEHHNILLNKADLHRRILNKSYCRDDRSIDMHVSRIRKKLVGAGLPVDALQTVRGQGYRLSVGPVNRFLASR